jgi:two-component system invasion response regulator UvrY
MRSCVQGMAISRGSTSIDEIGEAASGTDTLNALRRKEWDMLMMDIHIPDRSGLDILKHVKAGYPDLRILIMGGLPEEQYARNVLRAGADGYLSKGGSPQEMLKAVRLVLSGRRYVSPALAESLAADLEHPKYQTKPLPGVLSTREFPIFCKLAAGSSVNAIGEEVSLSVETVSTHRSRVLETMGSSASADSTGYALRNGLIQ